MNTPKTSFASSDTPPARRSATTWFATLWQRLGRSDEERFLAGATGPEDLELRLRQLERNGLPVDESATM